MISSRDSAFIRSRTEALGRFYGAYSGWRGSPPEACSGQRARLDFASPKLETRVKSEKSRKAGGDDFRGMRPVGAIANHLVHNAADAVLECGTLASVGWSSHDSQLEVWLGMMAR